jgi:hypothetical protein
MKGYVLVRWALIDTNQALTTAELNDFVSDIVYTVTGLMHGKERQEWHQQGSSSSGPIISQVLVVRAGGDTEGLNSGGQVAGGAMRGCV